MSILITGASGYVGKHLLEALPSEERAAYLTPSHKELNLSDEGSVSRYFGTHRVDKVIHLAAALDNDDPGQILSSNIEGLYYLLSVCAKHGVSYFLFVSGNNVYGTRKDGRFSETDRCRPLAGNRYGISKYCGELMVRDILSESSVKYGIARIADIYGPEQKTGALLKAVVGNIRQVKPQKLYGIGDRTRDYIYIDDVVAGLSFMMEHQAEGVYNLSTGVGTSVAEIIKVAEELSPCKEPTVYVAVEKEDHSCVVLNNAKLRTAGYTPNISIAEGLHRLVKDERNGG